MRNGGYNHCSKYVGAEHMHSGYKQNCSYGEVSNARVLWLQMVSSTLLKKHITRARPCLVVHVLIEIKVVVVTNILQTHHGHGGYKWKVY